MLITQIRLDKAAVVVRTGILRIDGNGLIDQPDDLLLFSLHANKRPG